MTSMPALGRVVHPRCPFSTGLAYVSWSRRSRPHEALVFGRHRYFVVPVPAGAQTVAAILSALQSVFDLGCEIGI